MSAAAPSQSDEEPYSPPPPAAEEPQLWTPAFINLVIAQALFGFAYSVFLLLPKLLAVGYGAGARGIGIVMASFGVVSLITVPFIGPIVGRLGRRQTAVVAFQLLGASALAFVTISSAGVGAALLRGAHGVAWALFFAAGLSLLADVVPSARLGQAIGLYGGAALAMNAIAPAIAEPIAAQFGAHPVFVLSAASAAAGAWFCRRLPAGAKPAAGTRPGATAGELLRARAAVLVVLAVGGLAAMAMFTFVAPFALAHGIHVVRGFFIAYTGTALLVRVAGARYTDRIGHRRVALLGGACYGLVVIGMGLLGPTHLLLLGGAFGVAHGIVFPALMALVLGGTEPAERPRLIALANGAINLGVVGVGLVGAVAERVGYPAVFVATGTLTLALSLLLAPPLRARVSASST